MTDLVTTPDTAENLNEAQVVTAEHTVENLNEAQVTAEYTADDILVLEGLEPVRQRPGMFIGSTGPDGLHHLVYEVIDNAIDEAMAGHCTRIDVTLLDDGGCRVIDDGRGIPTGPLKDHAGKSAVEVVLTVLHAGGKFSGNGYKVSGGLHGVGVSVVNALSSSLVCEVDRYEKRWHQEFRNGGEPVAPLAEIGPSPQGRTGTSITFHPDPKIFEEEIEFDATTLINRLRRMAFLNTGLRITFTDERSFSFDRLGAGGSGDGGAGVDGASRSDVGSDGDGRSDDGDGDGRRGAGGGRRGGVKNIEFCYEGGIRDFVTYLNVGRTPLHEEVCYLEQIGAPDGDVTTALQWNTGFSLDGIASFANGIATTEGGMHEQGFRAALTSAVNRYAREYGMLKEGHENLQGVDIREGLTAVISVRLKSPQFEGQTKAKLGNTAMKSLVQTVIYDQLGVWLEEHPHEGKAIVAKALNARKARLAAQQAKNTIRKSALEGVGLPGKLTDCSSKNPDECELYIVEGDSAGGSAKDARDPATMAILPIRGKILNVERSQRDRIYNNNEVQALISAIGASVGSDFDVTKIRYGKVILLCDADVDGSHIRALLLTFFYREMTELVKQQKVFIAQPPLYSTKVGAATHYLKDDAAKSGFLAERPKHSNEFTRLKGLGEMDFDELWNTTMDPQQRALLRVTVDEAEAAHRVFSTLMGDDVEQRKRFIYDNARDVQLLDI